MSAAVAESTEAHPHELRAGVPHRLDPQIVRALAKLEPRRALAALAVEWTGLAAVIGLTAWIGWPWLYPFAVIFIGARQAALTVLAHDAAHYRLLPGKRWNDWVGEMLAAWPTFITVSAYRRHHGLHHQHLGEPEDGNRFIWRTHTADGVLNAEWTYPKTPAAFTWKILRRSAVLSGLRWMLLGQVAAWVFRTSYGEFARRVAYTAAIAAALTAAGAWHGFLLYWVVPFCTWHMSAQYIRLVCEHSRLPAKKPDASPAYAMTRTTVARPWERLLIVPRNIGYHIEHHYYPAVPFYKLPELHKILMQQPGFAENAVVTGSVMESLGQVLSLTPGVPAST